MHEKGMPRYYIGTPGNCDVCNTSRMNKFVDGATHGGPWANMCLLCFEQHGVGLGEGAGQLYELVMAPCETSKQCRGYPKCADTGRCQHKHQRWLKTEG